MARITNIFAPIASGISFSGQVNWFRNTSWTKNSILTDIATQFKLDQPQTGVRSAAGLGPGGVIDIQKDC